MIPQRVLVVEDNDATATFVCQQLTEGGLVPEAVRGGLEALRRAHSQNFVLAVVDADIASEPNGVETADWLRRLYGVPVVVFSMSGGPDVKGRASSLQLATEVARPAPQDLSGVVANVLSALSRRTWEVASELGGAFGQSVRQALPGSLLHDRGRSSPPVAASGAAMPQGFAELSGREWQIIWDLIETPSAHAVALKRQRSPHTVHNHLKSIFRKLRVHSVAELLSLMLRLTRQVPIV
jgi:DNA-binding NarL/FixJ family response regulator